MNALPPTAYTRLLGQCVLSAYNAFATQPLKLPVGWKVARTITGWVSTTGTEELFALVLRYTMDPPDTRCIIAFRGSITVGDWLNDFLSILPTDFQPYPGGVVLPHMPLVGDGFQDIYVDVGQNASGLSMQQQLFQALSAMPISQLIVTGHSLGSALAELFMFDYSLQKANGRYRGIAAAWLVDYAAPCVGDGTWQQQYATYCNPLFSGAWAQSIRLVNQCDIVTTLPPDLEQMAVEFDVQFRLDDWYWEFEPGLQHSMLNYNFVVNQALAQPSHVWTGTFTDLSGSQATMISLAPDAATTVALRARVQGMRARAPRRVSQLEQI